MPSYVCHRLYLHFAWEFISVMSGCVLTLSSMEIHEQALVESSLYVGRWDVLWSSSVELIFQDHTVKLNNFLIVCKFKHTCPYQDGKYLYRSHLWWIMLTLSKRGQSQYTKYSLRCSIPVIHGEIDQYNTIFESHFDLAWPRFLNVETKICANNFIVLSHHTQ